MSSRFQWKIDANHATNSGHLPSLGSAWQELVAHGKQASSPLASAIELATSKIQANEAPEKGGGVFQTKKIQLEISRLYHIVSEQEIKRRTKVAKLSKAVLERVPTLTVPSEAGSEGETVYCFRHPDGELREARIKILLETTLESDTHNKDRSYFPEQPQHIWEATLQSSSDQCGVANVLEKEQYMTSFDQWASAKLNLPVKKPVVPESTLVASSNEEECEDEPGVLAGDAAGSADMDGQESFVGIAAGSGGPPLQRANSQMSLRSTPAKKKPQQPAAPGCQNSTPGSGGKSQASSAGSSKKPKKPAGAE